MLWVQEKVRTGAVKVRKVRGDVNPADIFTKHLPSRDKVHQLAGLFGCEYRSGRAASAPLLRPNDSGQGKGDRPSTGDALPTFDVAEAEAHDCSQLPHLYSAQDILRMFPEIKASPLTANTDDCEPLEDIAMGEVETRRGRR